MYSIYNGGFLLEIILLTLLLCDYIGEPFLYHVEVFVLTAANVLIPPRLNLLIGQKV